MMNKRFIVLGISLLMSISAMSLMAVKPQNNGALVTSIHESKVSNTKTATENTGDKVVYETQDNNSGTSGNAVSNGVVSRGAAASRPEPRFGEAIDWWKEAGNDFPRGSVAVVTDLRTGKSFNVKRTYGTNHADCEALTLEDTNIIKSIWGGFSWDRRPVIVKINGLRIAASMSAMPHAGLDDKPADAYVKGRSGGFGSGVNLDAVKGNGMDGHFDIHFLNSRRHNDNQRDPQHQANVMIAAGK